VVVFHSLSPQHRQQTAIKYAHFISIKKCIKSTAQTDSLLTAECFCAAEVDLSPRLISRQLVVKMMEKLEQKMEDLEALPVDNAGTCLIVLLL